jgi:hypothetical protein
MKYPHLISIISMASVTALCAEAITTQEQKDNFSPYLKKANPSEVYWGDTHLHTAL